MQRKAAGAAPSRRPVIEAQHHAPRGGSGAEDGLQVGTDALGPMVSGSVGHDASP